jgi:hypothetical protein
MNSVENNMTYMLQVENEFEDREQDWFEIQLNQH